jgi:hypothetical protein
MPNQPPSFLEYLKAFQSDFWTGMSGGASVPFTAAAIYFSGYTRLLFALLAVFCVIFSPFRLWQSARIEINNLKKRPYDDAKKDFVEGKLKSIGTDERDTLRYLVQFGERENEQIMNDAGLLSAEFGPIFTKVSRTQLLRREERQRVGRAGIDLYWWVNPEFSQVVKDELFPREKYDDTTTQRCFT